MKHNVKDWKTIYNNVFSKHKKSIRILEYVVSKSRDNGRNGKPVGYVLFNNGYKIKDGKITTLYGRMKKQHMIDVIDDLYSIDSNIRKTIDKKIKLNKSSKGGKKNWSKNREMLSQMNVGKKPWNKGLTKETDERVKECWNKGLTKETDERVKLMGESRVGKKNPMFGTKYTEEQRVRQSKLMKRLILDGKFTPLIKNSRTHWQCSMDERKYRSSWEALFHHLNPLFEYEKLRIEYNFNGKTRIYIVDFIDNKNKIVCEVKPKRQQYDERNKLKHNSLVKWSDKHGYELIIVDEVYIYYNYEKIDRSKFDKHSLKLLEKVYNNENRKNRKNRKT